MFRAHLDRFSTPCQVLLIAHEPVSFELRDPGDVSFWTPAYLPHWAVVADISSQPSARRVRDCERGRKFLRSGLVYKSHHLPLAHLSICSKKRMGKMNSRSCWDYLCCTYLDTFTSGWSDSMDFVFRKLLGCLTAGSTLWWPVASSKGATWQKNTAFPTS